MDIIEEKERWFTTVVMLYGILRIWPRDALQAKLRFMQIRKFWKEHIRNTPMTKVFPDADVFWNEFVDFCAKAHAVELRSGCGAGDRWKLALADRDRLSIVIRMNWMRASNDYVNTDEFDAAAKEAGLL